MTDAELFGNKSWNPIDIETALTMPRTRRMRCPECHGRTRAHKAGTNGMKPHMEHYERHPGCSRGDSYSGVASPHPKALT